MTSDGDINVIPSGMVRLAGGAFLMGSDSFYPEERPQRPARVAPFLIDRCSVTNADFAAFVAATGHVTLAERPADPALYPGATPEQLAPASAVFMPPPARVSLDNPRRWWRLVPGACWRHPEGPGL